MAHRVGSAICVVQAEDRPLTGSRVIRNNAGIARLLDHNRAACNADENCTYIRRDRAFHNVQPHWRKAFITYDILNTTRCGAVAWLDSDAVFAGRPSELLSLLHPNEVPIQQARDLRYEWPDSVKREVHKDVGHDGAHFVLAGENDVFKRELSGFNAGVWLVANTPLGRAIMHTWCNVWLQNASHNWYRDPSKPHTGQDDMSWSCSQPDEHNRRRSRHTPRCRFAGEQYEQGAFVTHVMADERLRQGIRLVPWHVLQNPHPRTIVHHFLGHPTMKANLLQQFFRYAPQDALLGGSAVGAGGHIDVAAAADAVPTQTQTASKRVGRKHARSSVQCDPSRELCERPEKPIFRPVRP